MSAEEEYDTMELEDVIMETYGHVSLANAYVTDQNIPFIIERGICDFKCTSLSLEDIRWSKNIGRGNATQFDVEKASSFGKLLNNVSMKYFSELLELLDLPTLTELYLVHTGVTDQGVKLIADVLQRNTSLTKLDLSCNSAITDDCLDYVLCMSKQNNALKNLDLCGCSVSESGKARVQQSFAKKKIYLHP